MPVRIIDAVYTQIMCHYRSQDFEVVNMHNVMLI